VAARDPLVEVRRRGGDGGAVAVGGVVSGGRVSSLPRIDSMIVPKSL
jgi:hypothetical protein